ncbi:MAG TPA: HAMP domain-containing sensor histidine kinase [Polyangiaceae bacterium]
MRLADILAMKRAEMVFSTCAPVPPLPVSDSEDLMNDGPALATGSSLPSSRLDQAARLERAVLQGRVEQLQGRESMRVEWTGMVVHELRRSLSVIDLSAQLLQEALPAEGKDAEEWLEQIRRGVEELTSMTVDLLDASAVEARAMRVEPALVGVVQLVEGVIMDMPDVVARCRLRAEPGSDVQVNADPRRIAQALGNLLENAQKYGDPEAEIAVDIARYDREVRVTVSSRGPGIPADQLSRVFDRFVRGRQTRREKAGLGLGLYIAKGLIEAHGGRIWATSAPGIITQFHFTLPVA